MEEEEVWKLEAGECGCRMVVKSFGWNEEEGVG